MKSNDIDIERNVLKCVLQIPEFGKNVLLYGQVIDSHFADIFHQDAFKSIKKYFNKFGTAPSVDKLKANIINNITYNKSFKTKASQREIYTSSIDRLFTPINKSIIFEKEANLTMLEEMRKVRLLQKFLVSSEENLGDGKIDQVMDDIGYLMNETKMVDNQIMEGNIVEDFKQHVNLIKQTKLGMIKPIPTGIVGVMVDSEGGTYKKVELDNFLDGGLYPAEMTLLIGENNVGKSFALMEIPVNASMTFKVNTMIATIEMNKIKLQRRIYSRITGIPYNKFKTGEITKAELIKVKEKLEWWKKNCGVIHIVSFDKGATVVDIEQKLRDAENRYGKEFGLLSIDYLNDMKPIGKYQNLKGWDAMGEISWDLSNLAKRANNRKGIPIITANQKKATKAGSGSTDWQDAAFSPLPAQHATVGIGIGQGSDDEVWGRIKWDIFKNREGGKSISFYTFPNFAVSKISSLKKMESVIDEMVGAEAKE